MELYVSWQLRVNSPGPKRPVEVEGRANQGQMGERLREIAEGLAAGARLLGVEAEVVGITEHLLEEQAGVVQPVRFDVAGAGERVDEPEGAHVEGPLPARQPIRGSGEIVPIAVKNAVNRTLCSAS